MANSELMKKLAQEKTRLKAATGELISRSEPIAAVHMLQFSILMLRCEFTTFMAMNSEKKWAEEDEYFKRVIDQIMFEVKMLEKSLQIIIDETGRIHKVERPKLLKPGSAGLPN